MKKMSPGRLTMNLISAAMTVLFCFWAYYQFNDPDATQWILVYAAAAVASGLFVINRLPAVAPQIIGGVCVLWAAYLSTQITYTPPLVLIEAWREMMGLLVVAAWMGVLAWVLYRAKTSRAKKAVVHHN